MIININGGGGKKANTKIMSIAVSKDQAIYLPYTVTLGFKPTWIASSGYQNTAGGGRSFGEVNQNNERTFLNPSNATTPTIYEPYVITSITEDGFQFIKNPNMSSLSYDYFYGSVIVTAGDGDITGTLKLP